MSLFTLSEHFAPHQALARSLLPTVIDSTTDGSHDDSHLMRVWQNVQQIMASEDGDVEILVAATILHDCVVVEKNSPDRSRASRLAADKARKILASLSWSNEKVDAVAHAIEAHSFSAGITPETIEAKILQDADRLDAIGAIGIARCFYVAGRMDSALYHPEDPKAEKRAPNDKAYAVDHFPAKLLTLADGFRTITGQSLAATRHQRMLMFLDGLYDEIME